ncbi:MAG: hypothetical protein LBC39_08235 [Methanobrevibacter sp.]|nr:hypothetical protein [Candidatus Methanovirga aequatorialis]
MDNENDVKIYKKLLYFKFKAMGYSIIESYNLASIKKSTAYYLEDLWNEGGYYSLLQKPGQGRKTKLNNSQLSELKNILDTKDEWLVNDVVKLIKENWGINYSYNGVFNILNSYFNLKISNYHEIHQKNKNNLGIIRSNAREIDFFENEEYSTLINYIKVEKDINTLKRLYYLLFKKLGFSTDISTKFIGVSSVTGNNWQNRWNKEGYDGLLHKKGQGRKPLLKDENLVILKKS